MCIFVEYMCVYNLAEKVPLVIEILAKQHRGSFLDTLYDPSCSLQCPICNEFSDFHELLKAYNRLMFITSLS